MSDRKKRIAEKIVEQRTCYEISCFGYSGPFKGTACPFSLIKDGQYCHDHAVANAKEYLRLYRDGEQAAPHVGRGFKNEK